MTDAAISPVQINQGIAIIDWLITHVPTQLPAIEAGFSQILTAPDYATRGAGLCAVITIVAPDIDSLQAALASPSAVAPPPTTTTLTAPQAFHAHALARLGDGHLLQLFKQYLPQIISIVTTLVGIIGKTGA